MATTTTTRIIMTAALLISTTNAYICNLCRNGEFPGKPNGGIAVLREPLGLSKDVYTCEELYWMGRRGELSEKACNPIVAFHQDHCRCGEQPLDASWTAVTPTGASTVTVPMVPVRTPTSTTAQTPPPPTPTAAPVEIPKPTWPTLPVVPTTPVWPTMPQPVVAPITPPAVRPSVPTQQQQPSFPTTTGTWFQAYAPSAWYGATPVWIQPTTPTHVTWPQTVPVAPPISPPVPVAVPPPPPQTVQMPQTQPTTYYSTTTWGQDTSWSTPGASPVPVPPTAPTIVYSSPWKPFWNTPVITPVVVVTSPPAPEVVPKRPPLRPVPTLPPTNSPIQDPPFLMPTAAWNIDSSNKKMKGMGKKRVRRLRQG